MSLALPVLLLAAGVVFVFAEIFFVSFGVLAVLAAASFIGACVSAFAISSSVGMRSTVRTSGRTTRPRGRPPPASRNGTRRAPATGSRPCVASPCSPSISP